MHRMPYETVSFTLILELFSKYLRNFQVVSDIGGFLGLFLGCSMLSIIEIIFFLNKIIAKIAFNLWREWRNDRRVQSLNPNIINVR